MKKPNILFILSDDQGAWAMGCVGNREIKTPNLDKLAARGLRFDNFFCVSPVCSPARASIVTGRIPSYHGVHDWIRQGCLENPGDFAEYGRNDRAIDYLAGIKTYPEILAENGYSCALSGKWHLGDHESVKPGFSRWYCHGFGGGPYYKGPMLDKGKRVQEEDYITDAITDRALEYLDELTDQSDPFYLSVHYTAPHSPWEREHHPKETWDSYYNSPLDSTPDLPVHPWQRNDLGRNRREALAGYFTAITEMDRNIGRLLDRLEERGIREETLVIFTADNGMNMGHHGCWGKGNATFPMNMYDTSVKVPFLVSQPGTIPQGKVVDHMVSHYDILPTLLDWTASSVPDFPDKDKMPGISFSSLLKGENKALREDVVVYDEYGPVRMIRTKEWKYVHRYPYGPHELYCLKTDPGEEVNLMDQALEDSTTEGAKKLEELRGRLDRWFFKHARMEQDGRGLDVTGLGQRDLVGPERADNSFFPRPRED
jgi:choline-sulfatase